MNRPGFTLVEMMIATWVYTVIMIGVVISVQVFALRIYTLSATKAAATASSIKTLNAIRNTIRQAKTVDIGNCNLSPNSFTSLGKTNWQIGNAIMVFPTMDTNNYTIFYLNNPPSNSVCGNPTNTLVEFDVSTNLGAFLTNTVVLASYITNTDIFTAQDCFYNTLTNDQVTDNRMIIYMKLQFYQWEYPICYVGSVGLNSYDFYQLQTRITRRATN